jgi:integrase
VKLLGRDLREELQTVAQYADHYINAKSGVEGKTLDHYRMFIRLHIGPTMGDLPLDAVTKEMVAGWVNFQAEDGHAAKSIKNRHGFLSAMFQSAVDDELITRNPCAKTNLPDSERGEMVFLSPDEFTTLLSYIPVWYQPLVQILANTGVRWGEATALKPGDFDLDATDLAGDPQPTVRISRAWKSSVARGWYLAAPKTKRSKRLLTLPVDMLPILRPLVESGREFVFTNSRGGAIRQQNFWSGVWNPARRLANGLPPFTAAKGSADKPWEARSMGVWDRKPAVKPLGKVPRIHDLRHSCASWLIADGIPLTVVQLQLGHESIKTTSDIYGHVTPGMMSSAAKSLGRTLAGSMPQLLP